MTPQEIRELSLDDIQQRINDCEEELFNLRYKKITAHLENPKRINAVKKDVARLKTIFLQKSRSSQGEVK